MSNKISVSSRLAISAAVATALLSGYGGRKAYAGVCGPASPSVCTGPATAGDVTQAPTPAATNLTVTTDPLFGITTAAGSAIELLNAVTDTGITFVDDNSSIISGDWSGLSVHNSGTGATSITTSGAVTGIREIGISVENRSEATDLSVTAAGDVTGVHSGIYTRNEGTGTTTVTTTGTAFATDNFGISARSIGTATDIIINAQGDTTGGLVGVIARNEGTGGTSITTTGLAAGVSDYGIFARNIGTATDIIINAQGDATGGGVGVGARNKGTGNISITTTGLAAGVSYSGIYAHNYTTAIDLTIDSQGDTTGGRAGIFAANYGTGTTSVTTVGLVEGVDYYGVFAKNGAASTDITINTQNNVTGGRYGIQARNDGSGAISITTTGAVTGDNNYGMHVYNYSANATDITINAQADVTGQRGGIFTKNEGSGVTSITAAGVVTGSNYYGIYAYHRDTGTATDITINAQNDVAGGYYGIYANNSGTGGATSITTTGVVTGNYAGIRAYHRDNGTATDITINAQNNVAGGNYGIYAKNDSTGTTSITSTGVVTATTYDGIYAYNNSTAKDIVIDVQGSVTGANNGVRAESGGLSGSISIAVTGAVTGGSAYGLYTVTPAGVMTTINLNAGADVSSTAGLGIYNDLGDSITTVITGAAVAGEIRLNNGDDDLIFAGGNFSGVILFDGGDDLDPLVGGDDSLTFQGSSGSLLGANVINWETIVVDASTIAFTDGVLSTGVLSVVNGGVVDNLAGLNLSGDLVNTGTINMQDGDAMDTTTVTGNYTGGGELNIDTVLGDETSPSDVLIVNGDTSGATVINLTNLGGAGATTAGDGILIVQVDGTSAGTFSLAGGPITLGDFVYSLVKVGNNWYLQAPDVIAFEAVPIPSLSQWAQGLLAAMLAGLGMFGFRRRV